jgi:hypothetical protein
MTCEVGGKKFNDGNADREFNMGYCNDIGCDSMDGVQDWTFQLYRLNTDSSRTLLGTTTTDDNTWSGWPNSFAFRNLDCSKQYIVKEVLKSGWVASGDFKDGVQDGFSTPPVSGGSEVKFHFVQEQIVIDTNDGYNGTAVSGFHVGNRPVGTPSSVTRPLASGDVKSMPLTETTTSQVSCTNWKVTFNQPQSIAYKLTIDVTTNGKTSRYYQSRTAVSTLSRSIVRKWGTKPAAKSILTFTLTGGSETVKLKNEMPSGCK